jgi:phosphoglycerate dehydrogenase-like enzyme
MRSVQDEVYSMTVVCLPDARARLLVGDPAGTEIIVWDGTGPEPPGLDDTEFLVGSYVKEALTRTQLARFEKLKVLQVISAGVDAWLGALPPGVTLCNGRGVHGLSTAEIAVTLILAHIRELPRYLGQQADHVWDAGERETVADKRVLILGAGDIGSRVAACLETLGASITLMGRTARAGVIGFEALPDVLPAHDVVVLALPLTAATQGLVDAGFLSAMKDHAILVNVGRGPTVVTAALLAELQSGRLRAGLDVVDPEPLPAEHPLWEAPNLVITPHVGGGAPGWDTRAYRLITAQIERYVAGEPLENVVVDGNAAHPRS